MGSTMFDVMGPLPEKMAGSMPGEDFWKRQGDMWLSMAFQSPRYFVECVEDSLRAYANANYFRLGRLTE